MNKYIINQFINLISAIKKRKPQNSHKTKVYFFENNCTIVLLNIFLKH